MSNDGSNRPGLVGCVRGAGGDTAGVANKIKAVILLALTMIWTAHAGEISFELLNESEFTLTKAYLTPQGKDAWTGNLLKTPLTNGQTATINWPNKKNWPSWDLRVEYRDQGKRRWEIFDALELPKVKKITVLIDKEHWLSHYDNR